MAKIKEYITLSNILLLLLCICSVSSYIGGPMFYGLLVIYSIYKIFSSIKNAKYNKFCIAFILIALISTAINYAITEPVFRVEQRMITLILVLVAFSPLISNRRIYRFRKKLFITLLLAITICALISSLMGFLGIGYMQQYLTGLFEFPNSLGYAQGLSIIFLASLINYVTKKIKILFIGCILIFIISIPLTGTRTAFYSIPIIFIWYLFFKSKSLFSFFKNVILLGIIAILASNFIKIDTSIIDQKNDLQEENGTSRDGLWTARIKEFNSSPILGIGTFRADLKWTKINKNGNVEAGNSFLMMLSMNGILGFLNFCFLYLSATIPFFLYMLKKRKTGIEPFELMLSLVLIFNFIDMQQAGLILNTGYYFTGINWLSIAVTYNIIQIRKNERKKLFCR